MSLCLLNMLSSLRKEYTTSILVPNNYYFLMPMLTEDVSYEEKDHLESDTSNFFSRVLSLMGNTRYVFGVLIDMEEGIVKFLEPLRLGYDSDLILRREIFQFMPDIIVCNSKISIIFDRKISNVAQTDEDIKIKSLLEVKGNKEFQCRDGENFISSVINKIRKDSLIDNIIYLELNSLRQSNFYKEYCCCLSSILPYVDRSAPGSGTVNAVCLVAKFERVNFKDIMSINFETFRALEIFEDNSTGQKGCTSLFNLLNQTSCKIGREKLHSAILRPTTDIKILKSRFDTIDIILKEISIKANENSIQSIIASCKSLPVITSTIKTFNTSLQRRPIWNQIRSYITKTTTIFECINTSEELKGSIYFRNFLDVFDRPIMNSLLEMISSTIDWNTESLDPQTVSVVPEVDSQLAEYRATYNDMEIILDSAAKEISKKLNNVVAESITVAYIPQLGFLAALDSSEETNEFIGEDITSSWFEVFSTGSTKYFKNETVERLDSQFGDVYSLICDAEIDILNVLQDEILKHADILLKVYNAIGDIDMMISLAKASLHLGFNRPTMVDEPILNICDMTHPFFKDSYVRNSLKLNNHSTDIGNSENIAVITGPNFSGKSTILKQCGVLVFLAHIGCFVPSTSAIIGITDAILTRMQNPEILDKPKSTFFSDCQQMSNCLNFSTQKSLLLIDEFGTGTDIYDGPALLISAINNLISREGSPRSIIATNFFEILKNENSFLEKKPLMYYMRTVLESVSSPKDISYLYQLSPGVTTTTFGIICAKHCGIPTDIIKRAQEIQETSDEYESAQTNAQEDMSHIEASIKLHLTQSINFSSSADDLRREIQTRFKSK